MITVPRDGAASPSVPSAGSVALSEPVARPSLAPSRSSDYGRTAAAVPQSPGARPAFPPPTDRHRSRRNRSRLPALPGCAIVVGWIGARPNGSSTRSARRARLASPRRWPRWCGSRERVPPRRHADARAAERHLRMRAVWRMPRAGGCRGGGARHRNRRARSSCSYDLAEDSLWGLGIGCSGAVDIRIERIGDDAITHEWLTVLERGEAAVLVTPLSGRVGTDDGSRHAATSSEA